MDKALLELAVLNRRFARVGQVVSRVFVCAAGVVKYELGRVIGLSVVC